MASQNDADGFQFKGAVVATTENVLFLRRDDFAHSHHTHSRHFDFPYFSNVFEMTGTGMAGMDKIISIENSDNVTKPCKECTSSQSCTLAIRCLCQSSSAKKFVKHCVRNAIILPRLAVTLPHLAV